jgi:predicted DNA-binding mobile mystery protein A
LTGLSLPLYINKQVLACMKADIAQIVRQGLDQRVPALRATATAAAKPARGWLRAVRTAAALSQDKVARKLGTTRQSYSDLELAEERGSASLNSIQRAAEAMDCELIYFIVPRESIAGTFSELAQLHDPKFQHLEASEHSMALEGQSVGDLKPRKQPST